jgi:hypothetical protein
MSGSAVIRPEATASRREWWSRSGLVGVGGREPGDGMVEGVGAAEVGGDGDLVPGAGAVRPARIRPPGDDDPAGAGAAAAPPQSRRPPDHLGGRVLPCGPRLPDQPGLRGGVRVRPDHHQDRASSPWARPGGSASTGPCASASSRTSPTVGCPSIRPPRRSASPSRPCCTRSSAIRSTLSTSPQDAARARVFRWNPTSLDCLTPR